VGWCVAPCKQVSSLGRQISSDGDKLPTGLGYQREAGEARGTVRHFSPHLHLFPQEGDEENEEVPSRGRGTASRAYKGEGAGFTTYEQKAGESPRAAHSNPSRAKKRMVLRVRVQARQTRTLRMGGRKSASWVHDSPESRLANTCPVLVPKYTPQGWRESAVKACRNTLSQASFWGRPLVELSQVRPPSLER